MSRTHAPADRTRYVRCLPRTTRWPRRTS